MYKKVLRGFFRAFNYSPNKTRANHQKFVNFTKFHNPSFTTHSGLLFPLPIMFSYIIDTLASWYADSLYPGELPQTPGPQEDKVCEENTSRKYSDADPEPLTTFPPSQVSPDLSFATFAAPSNPWPAITHSDLCCGIEAIKKTNPIPKQTNLSCFTEDQKNTPQADFADNKNDPTPVEKTTQIKGARDLSPPLITTPRVQKNSTGDPSKPRGAGNAGHPLNNFDAGVLFCLHIVLTNCLTPGPRGTHLHIYSCPRVTYPSCKKIARGALHCIIVIAFPVKKNTTEFLFHCGARPSLTC